MLKCFGCFNLSSKSRKIASLNENQDDSFLINQAIKFENHEIDPTKSIRFDRNAFDKASTKLKVPSPKQIKQELMRTIKVRKQRASDNTPGLRPQLSIVRKNESCELDKSCMSCKGDRCTFESAENHKGDRPFGALHCDSVTDELIVGQRLSKHLIECKEILRCMKKS